VTQAQRQIQELKEDISKLSAEGYIFIPEERFIDAQVYFDLSHFGQSAQLLTSLVDDDRFKADRKYFVAVRMLGFANFKEGNFQAARRQFERLRLAGVELETAMTFLVEIAARLQQEQELRRLAALRAAGPASDAMLYAQGKALFLVGDHSGALAALQRVSATAKDAPRAQYMVGASLVALSRMDDAIRVFAILAKTDGLSQDQVPIRDLANLALGRLAYEKGDFSAAANFYQEIPRDAPSFEVALYEVTNLHLRWAQEKQSPEAKYASYARAEELLDILVSITKSPELSKDARILRGRISMYMDKYDQAQEAYQEVIDLFAATSSELTDLTKDPESLDRFFMMMVRGTSSGAEVGVFVSQDVLDWLRVQPTLGQLVDMMLDLGRQRDAVVESRIIYEQLTYALSQDAARELFPGFSDVWLRALELETRLLDADAMLLDHAGSLVRKDLVGPDRTKAEQHQSDRKTLEKRLAGAPRTVTEYRNRSHDSSERLKGLAREAHLQVVRLQQIQDEILAMQRLVKEVKYKGSEMLEIKDEDRLTKDLQSEADTMLRLLADAENLQKSLEKEAVVAEVADFAGQTERQVKDQLWRQHAIETTFYSGSKVRVRTETAGQIDKIVSMHEQIAAISAVLELQRTEIDKKAQKQIAYYKQMLSAEKKAIEASEAELAETEKAVLRFAEQSGTALFLEAKQSLVKAVVEADLGLIDMSWKRKQEQTAQIHAIQEEKGRIIKRLTAELREISGEDEEK